MAYSIILQAKIILVCDSTVTVMTKTSRFDYGFVVVLIDILVIVVLVVAIVVVYVVVYFVIIVGNHNRNCKLLLCLQLGEFEAY